MAWSRRHIIHHISKRFKKRSKPRDPPAASSFVKQNFDRSFEPFVSADEFASNPDRGGAWTKIDHRQKNKTLLAEADDDALTFSSPDSVAHASTGEPQVLPRTPGIPTIAKYAQQMHRHGPHLSSTPTIDIIAEDDNFIFVHKPAGIACHGSEQYVYDSRNVDMLDVVDDNDNHNRRRKRKRQLDQQQQQQQTTLYDRFMEYWWTHYPFFRFQPRLLHRLDKDVSGVMVFAKKWCAEEHFTSLLHGHSDYEYGCGVKKCYIAVCKGIPTQSEGLIEGVIKKAHWNYKRFAIYPHRGQRFMSKAAKVDVDNIDDHRYVSNQTNEPSDGQYSRTEFKVVDTCEHGKIGICSLIVFTIHTGKRHQIRASAAALGCPIVGDTLYGGYKYGALLLHSLFVGFEGIVDTDLLYAVSVLPKWTHLSNHFWSTKAQYYTQQHLDFLMQVPRPAKKPKAIQRSMRRERAKLKQDLTAGKHRILLPFEADQMNNNGGAQQKYLESGAGNDEQVQQQKNKAAAAAREELENKYEKSGYEKMEKFVADNFIQQTIATHIKQQQQQRNNIKVYQKRGKQTEKQSLNSLIDGAVPSHFVDVL